MLSLAFCFVLDVPEAVSLQTFPKKEMENISTVYFTQCGPDWSPETDTIFLLIKMALLYAVPLAFMSIAYIQIIKVLWKSGNTPNHAFGKMRFQPYSLLLCSCYYCMVLFLKNLLHWNNKKCMIWSSVQRGEGFTSITVWWNLTNRMWNEN